MLNLESLRKKAAVSIATLVMAASPLYGCSSGSGNSEETSYSPPPTEPDPEQKTPEDRFAEWFIGNNLIYFSRDDCINCKHFEFDMNDAIYTIKQEEGNNYFNCGKDLQACIDYDVMYVPSFLVPGKTDLVVGYLNLYNLTLRLGYPNAEEFNLQPNAETETMSLDRCSLE